MKATYHAAKRYLERVLGKTEYSKRDLYSAYNYLNQLFSAIQVRGYKGYCPFPTSKKFVIAYAENNATTILPKEYIKEEIKVYKKNKKYDYFE